MSLLFLHEFIVIFCRLSCEKINNGIFVGPDTKKLFSSEHFQLLLNDIERPAFVSLMKTIRDVLYRRTSTIVDQNQIVNELITNFTNMGCNYSPKMHYIQCHLHQLLDHQYNVSDKHGEKVHQTMKIFETRYDGKSLKRLLMDFIWSQN